MSHRPLVVAAAALFAAAFGPGCVGEVDAVDPPTDPARPDAGAEVQDSGGLLVESDAGVQAPDAGREEVDAGPVGAFIAQGHLGRRTISCDEGRTWVADTDDALPNQRCWTPPDAGYDSVECDHQPSSGRGLAVGAGYVVSTFGWGLPGTFRRSADGVTWEVVADGGTYAGLGFVEGRFVAVGGAPLLSEDQGASWARAGQLPSGLGNVRRVFAGDLDGGLVVISADNGLALGDGAGAQWVAPTVPAGCRAGQVEGGIAFGNGLIVLSMADARTCRSTDRGATWEESTLPGTATSQLVWNGEAFVLWGRSDQASGSVPSRFSSTNGRDWTATPTQSVAATADGGTSVGRGPEIGVVAFGGGSYAAVNAGWDRWYEKQRFYRSDDGVVWEVLPTTHFKQSHPMRHMTYGALSRSAVCP